MLATLTVGRPAPPTPAELRLVDAIPRRYTDRGPYAVDRPGERAIVLTLLAAAEAAKEAGPRYWDEIATWSRVTAGSDGIPAAATVWPDPQRRTDVPLRRFFPAAARPVPAWPPPRISHDTLVLLGSDEDTATGWLRAGRGLALVLLSITAAGLAAQPLGPVTDLPASRAQLRRELGLLGYPQLLLRVGYGHGRPRTGRRDVEDVLVRAEPAS